MQLKNTLKLIAGCAMAMAAAGSFAHSDETHAGNRAVVKKEPKEWGIAGDAKSVKRTVVLTMNDNMRFSPDKLTFRQGETVRFVIKNQGRLLHELVIGTKKELDEHAALMLKFPTMEHEEPYMAHIPAGQFGELLWTFNRAGKFDFACLIAGHYQAGMVGSISVLASR